MQEAIESLSLMRGRPVLCLASDMFRPEVDAIRSLAPKLKDFDGLTVLLHSPGGQIEAAYRMVLALRRYIDDVEVLVPQWAKSAATFFCLSADTIYLGTEGELGPLDPQLHDRTGSARQISALETFKALEQLLNHSMESLDSLVSLLLMGAPMDVPHAIERAQPLFSSIVTPLYQQIDPHELGEMGRYLSEGEEYAKRVMRRWSYTGLQDNDIERIVRRLVWNYPTHGFVIDLHEAKSIGLNAQMLDEESERLCGEILDILGEGAFIGLGVSEILTNPEDPCDSDSDTEKEDTNGSTRQEDCDTTEP